MPHHSASDSDAILGIFLYSTLPFLATPSSFRNSVKLNSRYEVGRRWFRSISADLNNERGRPERIAFHTLSMTSAIEENGQSDHPISTEMIQIVSYDEEFNSDCASFLDQQRISQLGFDYHVTAIMGAQSSGKSTLLNLLFGTKFRTMDEQSGRYQVTQGVWMGRDSQSGILVMDLEGTDSRERGEDATTYERKSALFALALAEVLIVNVWAQDVGRYNAANMSLLKTVMELDLQLFFGGSANHSTGENGQPAGSPRKQRMHKTRLLFVLRDHVSSPFETLCGTLTADINNIWNTISKPEAAAGTPVTDYFDLDFFALPHKVLMENEFTAKGAELRRRFQENEVFLDEYCRGVAADGFSEYARSVWETIRANRELDIPSQKEMLAHVRCEQIAKEALANAETALVPLRSKVLPSDGATPVIVPALLNSLVALCNTALDAYSAAACRYSKTVADTKGTDLSARLGADCKSLFDAQVALASDDAVKQFRSSVGGSSATSASSSPWRNWGEVSKSAMENALKSFDTATSAGTVMESEEVADGHPLEFALSSHASARKRLVSTLDIELERATSDVLSAARSHCLKTFRDAFKAPLLTVLESASQDVWDRASEVSNAAWEATEREARTVYGSAGLGFDDEKLVMAVEDDIKPACYESAFMDIKDAVGTPANFLLRMTKRFEDAFRFDDRGVPRHFGPNEDIEALFVAARDKGEELLELLSEVKLVGPLTMLRDTARSIDSETSKPVLLEPHSQTDLREKLKRQAGVVFMEAKRAQEAAKITTKVPIWIFAVLLVLGWNELLAILRNPLLLLLTVILVPVFYVGYTLDAPTMLGPAVRATVNPLLVQAKDFLEQATATPNDNSPSASSSSITTDALNSATTSDISTNIAKAD